MTDTKQDVRWVLVWYGWRNWIKRPAWYCHINVGNRSPFADINVGSRHQFSAREWGLGPISLQRRVGW